MVWKMTNKEKWEEKKLNTAFRRKYGGYKPKTGRKLKYEWSVNGVNDSNRKEWQRIILRKNPWMDDNLFYNSMEARHLRSISTE